MKFSTFWLKWEKATKNEFLLLRDLHERYQSIEGLSVVYPVGYLEEIDALVTLHCDGESLMRLMKQTGNRIYSTLASDRHTVKALFECGRWLGVLHTLDSTNEPAPHEAHLNNYVRVRLHQLFSAGKN